MDVNGQTFLVLVSSDDSSRNGRDIVACIGFSSNEKGSVLILWIFLQELLEEFVHLISDFSFISDIIVIIRIGKSSSNGLVNIEKICIGVPATKNEKNIENL